MRMFLIAVAALAGLKVWTQDRLYRSVMGERLVAAYKDRAAESCHNDGSRAKKPPFNPWAAAENSDVVIGDAAANVAIWDLDNPMWNVRFRHPHLILTTAGTQPKSCAYDLVVGLASVRQR